MQSDGYQVLELPYQGNRLVMDVLLPSAGSGLSGLDVGQLPADLNGWLQCLTSQEVDVSLPKFQMATSFELSQPLEALGMTDAFGLHADFSGISASPLSISSVVHKAFIDVDETGTEAAAATAVGMETACCVGSYAPTVVFNADHPFLFLIRDTQSGSVLFMGQVADPSTTGGDSSAPAVPKGQSGTPITTGPIVVAPPLVPVPILLPNPVVIDPPSLPSIIPAVQLTTSAAGLTNLNNSSPAKAPRFKVSGLMTPPAGDTVQVIVYADGTQIGQAVATGSSVVVTANGTTRLADGAHQITAVEKLAYPASHGAPGGTTTIRASNAETITVGAVAPQITSTPVTQASPGATMNYQITTTAAATEQLTYRLLAAPAGMAISSSGKISWDPAIGTTSPQRVDVRVIDQFGNVGQQAFSISLVTFFRPLAPAR
jgi:hypothetical protein